MSQANVEKVQRIYEVWNGDGMQASVPLFDPGVEFVNPDMAIEPGTRRGHDGLVKALEALDGAFAEYAHEPEELIDLGDKVLAMVRFRARGRDSGAEIEISEQHVWTFRDGKVVRFEWFHDERKAKRAAGLQSRHA